MSIKRNSNHISKECSMKDTSEMVENQQEKTKTNEKKEKEKNRENAREDLMS